HLASIIHTGRYGRVGTGEHMIHVLLMVLDLGGTFVFAISGAVAATRHRLDIFGVMVFFRQPLVARLEYPVQWFDAIGLAFFAVAGAQKALLHGLGPAMAALL